MAEVEGLDEEGEEGLDVEGEGGLEVGGAAEEGDSNRTMAPQKP